MLRTSAMSMHIKYFLEQLGWRHMPPLVQRGRIPRGQCQAHFEDTGTQSELGHLGQ